MRQPWHIIVPIDFPFDPFASLGTLRAMSLKPLFLSAIAVSLLSPLIARPAEGLGEGVKITEQPEKVRVEINGQLFTEYVFKGAPHVYFYPLLGPGGLQMTRHWPMKDVEGEEHDHKHHRSLWYSHGAVNGVDFWGESEKSGKILHEKFLEIKSGPETGLIRAQNKWVDPDGKTVLRDERTFRVYARPDNERLFDYEITLKAPPDKEVILGDTKEGSMAIRLAESMRLILPKEKGEKKAAAGKGHIILSTGLRDQETWGKAAAWCDYHGPVAQKTVGVAIFDHPSNLRHPTTWHVRDYGLFAANPFGLHDFDKQPPGTGNVVIEPGKSVTFKYRFYLHEGDEKEAKVADHWEDYKSGK